MKEDVSPTKENTPSNQVLEDLSFQNQKQVSEETKAEAYKLHRWRNQAEPIR